MTHHSDQPFFSQEQLNEWAKKHNADEFTKNMPAAQTERLKEKANLVASLAQIESMLESIFAAEKDSNLIRILSGGQ
jgi:hypothetical protein